MEKNALENPPTSPEVIEKMNTEIDVMNTEIDVLNTEINRLNKENQELENQLKQRKQKSLEQIKKQKIITGLAILGLIGYIIYVNRQYISFLNTEEKNKKKNDVIIKHKDTKTDKKKNDVITKYKDNKINNA